MVGLVLQCHCGRVVLGLKRDVVVARGLGSMAGHIAAAVAELGELAPATHT